MLRDDLAMVEVDGDAGDVGQQASVAARKDAVALFRHYLSQYREKEMRSSAISSGEGILGGTNAGFGEDDWVSLYYRL